LDDSPTHNRLLSRLSRAGYERLRPDLEPILLCAGDILYEPDEAQSYIYFPTSCVVSLVYTMKNGATGEMGLVGNDGAVGIALYMGGGRRPNRAVVHMAGGALRMKASALRAALRRWRCCSSLAATRRTPHSTGCRRSKRQHGFDRTSCCSIWACPE
jgi:hypothetical protein